MVCNSVMSINMPKFIHRIKNIALLPILFWVIINIVLTQQVFALEGEEVLTNPLGKNVDSFEKLIEIIATIAAKVGIPIAAIFIIYSGLLFVTARGNEEQLKKAKKTLTWALIGTAILLGAWVIADIINTTVTSL